MQNIPIPLPINGGGYFYNGYIMGTAFYKYTKNHKILCFFDA